MELLRPITFAATVRSSRESLDRISLIVGKYLGQEKADMFLAACDALDDVTANNILDDTVKTLTGYDTVSIALNLFAEKFPQLSPEIQNKVRNATSEKNKVLAIESFRDEIMEILSSTSSSK